MGTYDTSGGGAISPDAPDESCDFCERDPEDCQCSPEVLNNMRTERAFMLAVKGIKPTAVVRAVNDMGMGVNFTGCGKKSIAQCWAKTGIYRSGSWGLWRPHQTLAYIRRKALEARIPSEMPSLEEKK